MHKLREQDEIVSVGDGTVHKGGAVGGEFFFFNNNF